MKLVFLSLDEILEIHGQQIERYGGFPGLRDAAALESAVAAPQATFGGEFPHTSVPAMAAAYLFHLCQNHSFLDGNKRAGANAAVTFLLMNDWEPTFDVEELAEVVLSVASGVLSKPRLIEIFESRCRRSENARPRSDSQIGPERLDTLLSGEPHKTVTSNGQGTAVHSSTLELYPKPPAGALFVRGRRVNGSGSLPTTRWP